MSECISFRQHDTALRYAKDPSQFRREAEQKIASGTRTIFVGEIQKVPALLDEIHGLIERTAARFILTGSSARKLRRGGANLLAGRAALRRLHPLTLQELGAQFDLDRVLRFGTLPAVVTASDGEARELLRAYGEVYLREEIQAESVVRNVGGFARFLDVVAAQSGEIVNFSAIGRDASVATRTVESYFQILEDTLVGFRLEAWRSSPRARMVTHPRFYLFDPGVTNALNRRLTAPPEPATAGRLFEQWIILECRRQIDYANDEARLYYWRTGTGAEVDLLVEKHGQVLLAAEIRSRASVSGADLTGLRSFAQAHPGVPCAVACPAPEEYRLGEIQVIPFARFLGDSGSGCIRADELPTLLSISIYLSTLPILARARLIVRQIRRDLE